MNMSKTITRDVVVISDLHLGGALADPASSDNKRGFRMMTHPEALAAFICRLAALKSDPPIELGIPTGLAVVDIRPSGATKIQMVTP